MAGLDNYTFAFDAAIDGSPMNHSAASMYDEYSNDPAFIESQREFRNLLFDTARETGPTRPGTPVSRADEGSDRGVPNSGGRKSISHIQTLVSTGERVMWLKNYINEVAPWLDMFDVQQTFGRKVPLLAKSSAPLTYAILAISTRQMERQRKLRGDYNSLQLYQESIGLLTPQLQARDPNILATCVILCCLEMMSAAPRNWRKHLDGCAALFESYGIHGFSGGIPQSVFWCYARMGTYVSGANRKHSFTPNSNYHLFLPHPLHNLTDLPIDLCAAIISEGEQSSVLVLDKWLPPNVTLLQAGPLFCSSGILDMYANYAVWLCARACHLSWVHTRQDNVHDNDATQEPFIHSWHNLWIEVQKWAEARPVDMRELDLGVDGSQSEDGTFPFILFPAPCAISSNQLYHTACLLLLKIKPSSINTQTLGHTGSSMWHAHRICGISLTNSHHGCLNNAIQPLWLAGKLLSHPTEHKLIVDLITKIESITGWSGAWRVRDLKRLWGYGEDDTSI